MCPPQRITRSRIKRNWKPSDSQTRRAGRRAATSRIRSSLTIGVRIRAEILAPWAVLVISDVDPSHVAVEIEPHNELQAERETSLAGTQRIEPHARPVCPQFL